MRLTRLEHRTGKTVSTQAASMLPPSPQPAVPHRQLIATSRAPGAREPRPRTLRTLPLTSACRDLSALVMAVTSLLILFISLLTRSEGSTSFICFERWARYSASTNLLLDTRR